MASITVDSHDVLGKLSIVKNYLSVVQHALETNTTPDASHVGRAISANEDLIQEIKEKATIAKK